MSNLASPVWTFNGSRLQIKEEKHLFLIGALIIFNMTSADAGFYECQSVEKASGKEFHVTVATYLLYPQQGKSSPTLLHSLFNQIRADSAVPTSWSLVPPKTEDPVKQGQSSWIKGRLLMSMLLGFAFAFLFLALLAWNVSKGHLTVSCKSRDRRTEMGEASGSSKPEIALAQLASNQKSSTTQTIISITSESAPLMDRPREGGSGKVKHGSSPKHGSSHTKGSVVCSSPSFELVKTKFPSEDCKT